MASIRSKNNKWQARIKRGQILAEKSFINKRDAERWARLTEAEIERGDYKPPSSVTLDQPATLYDLLDRYEKEVAPQHRSATTCFNIGILKRTLGETTLAEFNAQVVARWRDERLKTVKPPTVARGLNTLSAILNHARKEWCNPIINPIQDIKRPAQSQARTRRLEAGEEDRLLAALEPHYARVVRFALVTGMRRGEILSMQWRNLDMSSHVALLPITKNGESRRVPLSTVALRIIEEQRQEPVQSICGRVFDIHPIALDKAWHRACKLANIENLHFHDLRHEAVSRLFERGLNLMEVASISGHKTLAMLQRYTHLRAEELARKLG
jgi:integrase